jgi:hypothetical protein
VLDCPDRDLGPGVEAQLVQNVSHMHPSGALGNYQALGYLAIG